MSVTCLFRFKVIKYHFIKWISFSSYKHDTETEISNIKLPKRDFRTVQKEWTERARAESKFMQKYLFLCCFIPYFNNINIHSDADRM